MKTQAMIRESTDAVSATGSITFTSQVGKSTSDTSGSNELQSAGTALETELRTLQEPRCRKLGGGRMLLVLVSLLCWVPAARACLQCDRKIRLLLEDFTLSAPTVYNQIELKKICDHAYVTYKETSRDRKGVIGELRPDPTTLYRVRTEYHSELDRFLKTKHTGSVTFEAIQILEKGRKILEKHLDTFIRDGRLCPNTCGKGSSVATRRPVIPPPSLPRGDDSAPFQPTAVLLVPVVAVVTALSLAASVGLAVVLG
ncbi:hypothetical protein EYF80_032494 [Liparis tanakae]|uniref:Uncharacterized protein n=1 Tax=Liparis tanakae TaxID=230148 RepID=A0A4Z2GW32_9TELE|nr:hypothetical protein EYF80_032494 [Liparis tanakae]